MSAGRAVSATFAPIPQQTLSVSMAGNGSGSVVSDPAGIDCGEFCSAPFDSGGVVTLSAHPSPGSRFAGWSGSGCSGTGDCDVTVAAGSSVTANFARIEHTVTVGKTGAGAGAISSQPGGISCGGACSGHFLEGDVVTLTAVPATGSVFAGWSGPCTGRRSCTFVVAGDTAVRAEFRVAEWTLAVALGGEGLGTVDDPSAGIHCGLTCSGVYLHGTSITLVAKPSPGSFFAGWHGCDRPEGATCHATVDREETVGAIFSISPTIGHRKGPERRRGQGGHRHAIGAWDPVRQGRGPEEGHVKFRGGRRTGHLGARSLGCGPARPEGVEARSPRHQGQDHIHAGDR